MSIGRTTLRSVSMPQIRRHPINLLIAMRSDLTIAAFLAILILKILAAPSPIPASQITAQSTYLILSADVSQPFSSVQGVNPEFWDFTVVGQWAGATPVHCSLQWNAGIAIESNEGQKQVDISFNNCSDPSVTIDMTRFQVEPWFLWQLSIQARYADPLFLLPIA